jgi:hypothetical protein
LLLLPLLSPAISARSNDPSRWTVLDERWDGGGGVLDARYIRSFFSLFARCFGVCVLRLLTRLSTDGPSRLRILLYEEWRTTRLLRAGLELGGWGMVRPPRKVREIEENSFPFLITFTSVLVIRIRIHPLQLSPWPLFYLWRKSSLVVCTSFTETRGEICSRELCGWVYARGCGSVVGGLLGMGGSVDVVVLHSFST